MGDRAWANETVQPRFMNQLVACFAGRIAIGKTSVSRELARTLSASWTGFGDYVREITIARGFGPDDRDKLQEIGASLIEEHGFDWFCREVIERAQWNEDRPLVVDGIRHAEAFHSIARLLPCHKAVLIYLTVDNDEILHQRSSKRGVELTNRERWESHSTERQVLLTLPAMADLTLSANQCLDKIVKHIVTFLHSQVP